jgi:hypothetical protein
MTGTAFRRLLRVLVPWRIVQNCLAPWRVRQRRAEARRIVLIVQARVTQVNTDST